MIKLNDYLYSGNTVFKILKNYGEDLEKNALAYNNEIDLEHAKFLAKISDILEHNDFLTSQSQRMREFYKHMVSKYPYLAFTFKGRIKSLIRAEEKFNGYIVEYICEYYEKHGRFPETSEIKESIAKFRDLIAYRIIISLPKCHLKPGQNQEEEELKLLYDIANILPAFLEERGFTVEDSNIEGFETSDKLKPELRNSYRDYVLNPRGFGYKSLHITLFDNLSNCYVEVQLRTKKMDDTAEIGTANHLVYEKIQEYERTRRGQMPEGECKYLDEAFERCKALQELELSEVDVNMFAAASNTVMNDGCGLFRGRLILPFEHLSRFQNDIID